MPILKQTMLPELDSIRLKNLGFNEGTFSYRKKDGKLFDENSPDFKYSKKNFSIINSSLELEEYTIPTLGLTLEWLRNKGIYVYSYPIKSTNLKFRASIVSDFYIDNVIVPTESYHVSISEGIKKALTYLESKNQKNLSHEENNTPRSN